VINHPEVKIIGKSGAKEQVLKLSGETLQDCFGKRARAGQRLQSRIKPIRFESPRPDSN
jgi:hypothetical protein